MGTYVDGYVMPVPKDKVSEYRKLASDAGKVFREHGALEYVECLAEDVKPGKLTSFPQSVMLKEGETVIFSWIRFASREDRDRINEEVMKDPTLKEAFDPAKSPFDMKRMFFGGFEELVRF
jgi:uncharacterized protein YbaA (DUF1428 family)